MRLASRGPGLCKATLVASRKVICERACATQAAFARAWCSRLAAARIRLLTTTACRNRAERGRAPPRPRNIAEAHRDTVTFGAWHGHRKQLTWDTATIAHHGARNVLFQLPSPRRATSLEVEPKVRAETMTTVKLCNIWAEHRVLVQRGRTNADMQHMRANNNTRRDTLCS